MNPDQLARLQRIFRDIFDDSSLVLSPETSPAQLPDWDSVAMVQIVLAAEQEFGARLTTEEVAGIKSVADILRALETKTGLA